MAQELDKFLSRLGLAEWKSTFQAHGLTMKSVLGLGEKDLIRLGIEEENDRRRLIAAIAFERGRVAEEQASGWKTTSDPAAASRERPFVNCMGMLFVPIPRFRTLFSICPVRVCDFEAFCRKKGRTHPRCDFEQEPDHPVVGVSWEEATAFCEWLTEREQKLGLIRAPFAYRLPTDLEWSAAVGLPREIATTPKARSGRMPGYPWGGSFPPGPGAGNYHPVLRTDDFRNTSPVASFDPNSFGIYDLGGNVWEFCVDALEPGEEHRVARGASCFNDKETLLASSYREKILPFRRRNNIGFRVVYGESLLRDAFYRVQHDPWK